MDKNFDKRQKIKRIILLVFWIYVAIVFRITVFRSGFGWNHLWENGSINLTLFQGYIPIVKEGHWFLFLYLFVGNIIWFIPFGMYLEYSGKVNNIRWILLYGFLFSLTIESLQYVFGTGYSELDDLILNTFGVWIGAIFWKIIRRIRERGCAGVVFH